MKPSDLPKPQNRQARIEPLSVLPVFLDLHGKLAIVVGESEGALWKMELLLQSGAKIQLICQRPSAAMLQLVTDSNTMAELVLGDWRSTVFDGAFVVIEMSAKMNLSHWPKKLALSVPLLTLSTNQNSANFNLVPSSTNRLW